MKVKIVAINDGSVIEEVESKFESVHIWPGKWACAVSLVRGNKDYLLVQVSLDDNVKVELTEAGSVIIKPRPEEVFE